MTTQNRKLSKTTAVVSASIKKDLAPYWNASCEVINSALLLPIGIDSPVSAVKSYSSWSNKTVEKSWFSTKLFSVPSKKNSLPISSQFCTSFPVECLDSDDIVTKSKKIEIFPTLHQKEILRKMKMSEPLPAQPQGKGKVSERDTDAEVKDSQLLFENGRYFLCVPYVEKKKTREPSGRIVALDPGVRDFMTFFSEDCFGWLGMQCINRIQRLCQHCDNLYARATQEKRPLRRALRKAANRIKVKIRNLIDELHKKVAHFLVTNFDIILLPTFQTQQMTKRGGRKLRRKSVRQMLTLSHYRFKAFLKHKALEYGVRVIDVCEAYTSKTVSWTGEVIANLGGSKVIKSSEGHRMDRDLNGARGIFIKNVARALTVRPCTVNLGASKSLISSAT